MSEVFIEKMVHRKKTGVDILITIVIILAALLLMLAFTFLPYVSNFWFILNCGVIFGAYYLIKSRDIEYEYIVTNSDIDIDRIVAKRRRKRIYSGNCKDFELLARVRSDHFEREAANIKERIDASSTIDAEDAYFIKTQFKGKQTIVIFQPDERILRSFRMFIPRRILN